MPSSIEEFSRRQLIEFFALVKVVRLEMLPAVNGPMIGVLKQPGLKASASGLN